MWYILEYLKKCIQKYFVIKSPKISSTKELYKPYCGFCAEWKIQVALHKFQYFTNKWVSKFARFVKKISCKPKGLLA